MADLEIIIRPEAEQDIRESYTYYEKTAKGLGADFLSVLDSFFLQLKDTPAIYQIVYKSVTDCN